MTSDFFAQINGNKILAVTQATPPHELQENQIDLTKAEYDFLSHYHIDEAEIIIKSVRSKMEGAK